MPYSKLPKIDPIITGLSDAFCLAFLVFYRSFKLRWRHMSDKGRARTYIMAVLLVIQLVNTVFTMLRRNYYPITNLIRPIVVIMFSTTIRNNIYSAIQDTY